MNITNLIYEHVLEIFKYKILIDNETKSEKYFIDVVGLIKSITSRGVKEICNNINSTIWKSINRHKIPREVLVDPLKHGVEHIANILPGFADYDCYYKKVIVGKRKFIVVIDPGIIEIHFPGNTYVSWRALGWYTSSIWNIFSRGVTYDIRGIFIYSPAYNTLPGKIICISTIIEKLLTYGVKFEIIRAYIMYFDDLTKLPKNSSIYKILSKTNMI